MSQKSMNKLKVMADTRFFSYCRSCLHVNIAGAFYFEAFSENSENIDRVQITGTSTNRIANAKTVSQILSKTISKKCYSWLNMGTLF